jgi:hypothetical protein
LNLNWNLNLEKKKRNRKNKIEKKKIGKLRLGPKLQFGPQSLPLCAAQVKAPLALWATGRWVRLVRRPAYSGVWEKSHWRVGLGGRNCDPRTLRTWVDVVLWGPHINTFFSFATEGTDITAMAGNVGDLPLSPNQDSVG